MILVFFILAQLVLVIFYHPMLLGLNLLCALSLCVWRRKIWTPLHMILVALLSITPLFIHPPDYAVDLPQLTDEDLADLIHLVEFDNHFDATTVDLFLDVLDSTSSGETNEKLDTILDKWNHPSYVSFSLLNLNYLPVGWVGHGFADAYRTLDEDRISFSMRDGRFFASKIIALPSQEAARGYAVLEVLLLSVHEPERPKSWIVQRHPQYKFFLPVVVQPSVESDFLYNLTRALDLEVYPFEINFVLEPQRDPLADLLACFWALLLMVGLWVLRRRVAIETLWPILLGSVVLLALPLPIPLDHLTSFGSYIFGTTHFGNLLATPFHFFLSVHLIYFLLQSLSTRYLKRKIWWGFAFFPLALALTMVLPGFLQNHSTFSYIHPLEAFSSAGALLSYIAFLFSFGYLVLLMTETPNLSLRQKLPLSLGLLVLLGIMRPDTLMAGISLTLIWFMKKIAAPFYMRAALTVLLFYPYLVVTEHHSELAFVRNQLLDEVALMVERNYFRMGRIIAQTSELHNQLADEVHPHLMEMFAKQCGLLSDEIDFALQLSDPSGLVISSIEQHVSLEQVRYYDVRRHKIEISDSQQGERQWMIYRTTMASSRGEFELVAVLGNDYQNLSLVRRLRRLDQSRLLGQDRLPAPYFAYILDVFDLTGNPIYSQGKPNHLRKQDLERLNAEPFFWYTMHRDTHFLFVDQEHIYRITHKATPLKMIFVRWLSLFLVMVLLINGARWAQHSGRSLVSLWRRSFTLKMAGFMFLTSVLPTSTLGFFLVQSIQKNQASEEEALARSKILAAKNLLSDHQRGEEMPRDELDPNLEPYLTQSFERASPNRVPIAMFSQILGEDLSLFYSGSLVKTNQPEVFRLGLLDRRLDAELAEDLGVDRRTYTLERRILPNGGSLLVAYSMFPLSQGREAVLAMTMIPFSQRQVLRWREQLEFSLSILFGLLFLMAWITRILSKSFLRPVSAITRAASRMAKNKRNSPIVINRQDELQQMVNAFNAMRERIQESQSQLEDQLQTLDETLKSMSSGLLGLSSEGAILLENQRAWELLGLPEKHLHIQQLFVARPGLLPLKAFMKYSDAPDFAFHMHSRDLEREIQVKARKVATMKQQKIRYLVILEDITDALAASRFKAWSEMARRVAHEIKNPLTPIRLEIDHLNRLYQDNHPDFAKALAETTTEINLQVEHLKTIATEFADYARPVDSCPEPVNLVEMIRSMVTPYQKTLQGMDFQLELPERMLIEIDPKLIRRALHNLINNALQAMNRQGVLRISLKLSGPHIVLTIQDNGPGIPKDVQARIFEAYFSTKDQGTGLGLVIAKKYITLHEGKLFIDPDFSEGTRFVIHLPKKRLLED